MTTTKLNMLLGLFQPLAKITDEWVAIRLTDFGFCFVLSYHERADSYKK